MVTSKQGKRLCYLCRVGEESDAHDTEESTISYSEEAGNMDLFGPICVHTVVPIKRFLEKFGAAYKNTRFREKFGINHLTMTINSLGGDAEQGLALYDLMQSCTFPINTIALGEVASAAMMPYLAGRLRYIHPNAFLLTHRSFQESEDSGLLRRSDWYTQQARNLDLLDHKSTNIILSNSNLTKRALVRLQREEGLITAEEALKYGLAHEIIKKR